MGEDLCCSRQLSYNKELNFKNPETNIKRNPHSYQSDNQDINIIENENNNNNFDESKSNNYIYNDEFIYERVGTKPSKNFIKQNNSYSNNIEYDYNYTKKFNNNYIFEDKYGPQDGVKLNNLNKNDKNNLEFQKFSFGNNINNIDNIDYNNINNNNMNNFYEKGENNNLNLQINNIRNKPLIVIDNDNKINITYKPEVEHNINNNDNNEKEETMEQYEAKNINIENSNVNYNNNINSFQDINEKKFYKPLVNPINNKNDQEKNKKTEKQIEDLIENNNNKSNQYGNNTKKNYDSQITNNEEMDMDNEPINTNEIKKSNNNNNSTEDNIDNNSNNIVIPNFEDTAKQKNEDTYNSDIFSNTNNNTNEIDLNKNFPNYNNNNESNKNNNKNNIINNSYLNSIIMPHNNNINTISDKFNNKNTENINSFTTDNNTDNFNYNFQEASDPPLSDEEIDEIIKKAECKEQGNEELAEPALSDEEVDEILKEVERREKNNNYQNKIIYTQTPSKISYQQQNKYQPRYQNNNNNMTELQKYFNSSEQNKIYRPMTPEYHPKKNYYNNIETKYAINSNPYNNHINNYTNSNNINYAPIKRTNQIQYGTNPYSIPSQNIKYQSPSRTYNNLNYLITPPRNQKKQVIIPSQVKINQPLVQYKPRVVNTKPVAYTYNNKQPQNLIYNTFSNPLPTNAIKYVRKVPMKSNIYQQQNNNNILTCNYNNNINNNANNMIQYQSNMNNKTSMIEKNPSIINTKHFETIQRINQTNPYNINSIYNSQINLNQSYSSLSSSSSNKPRRYDHFGNPIYSASLHNSPYKIKTYQNYSRSTSPNLRRSFSSDGFSEPLNQRRTRLNNYLSPNNSRNESPNLRPVYNNQNIINNNNININNSQRNNINIIDNARLNNNNINQSRIYNNRISNNNINNNRSIIQSYQRPQSIINSQNNSISSSSSILENLNLNEQDKAIIHKYSSLDLTDPTNFYPSNFNLFYNTSPNFFYIPPNEIVSQKQLVYPVSQAVYTGGVNIYNQKHGLGQLKDPNITKIGSWRNNQFTGWGRVIRKNGQVFEGKFVNNKLDGKGVYSYRDVLFIGNFQNGVRQGKGILLTKSMKYKGQFNKGKIDGYGKILFLNDKEGKSEYEGFFKENNIDGKGIMKWTSGNMYEGEMKNGKMNGRGKFIPYNGIPIEGIFKNDVKVSSS